jgi:hypothetical protein
MATARWRDQGSCGLESALFAAFEAAAARDTWLLELLELREDEEFDCGVAALLCDFN